MFAAVGPDADDRPDVGRLSDALRQMDLFHAVPADVVEHVAAAMQVSALTTHDVLMREGDEGDGLYLLLRGSLTLSARMARGGEEGLRKRSAGAGNSWRACTADRAAALGNRDRGGPRYWSRNWGMRTSCA